MQQKTVKQPIITQSELNKIKKYQIKIRKSGFYSPWVTVRQSHTHGQGQILTSHKADHPVHLLSMGELNSFLINEHNPSVTKIYGQFPLCIFETMKIAKNLNIVHPGNYKERAKHDGRIPAKTMTTDLVVLKRDSSGIDVIEPYSFKLKEALDESETSARSVRRTLNKLKIETEYWSTRSTGLRLIDESFYCMNEIYNLEYLRECFDHSEYIEPTSPLYISALITFKEVLSNEDKIPLKECIEKTATAIGIEPFHSECVFKHATYQGLLPIDLNQKIELWLPLPMDKKENPYAY